MREGVITHMEKYLVTIAFRYSDAPKFEEDSTYRSKTITIGVFDTRDEANFKANKVLEIFESKFELNKHYKLKERFTNTGGSFGSPKDLISNLAYLTTPFEFYAEIKKLKYDDIEQTILEVVEACNRYKHYRNISEEIQ